MSALREKLQARIDARTTAPAALASALAVRLAERPPTGATLRGPAARGPGNKLTEFIAERIGANNPEAWAEIKRIINLPVINGYPKAKREEFQRKNVEARFYERGFRLRDVQVDAVLTYLEHAGLFAPIGVGHGKTAITLMLAGKAYAKGLQKILLLVPPQVVPQLVRHDLAWTRERVALHGVPFMLVNGDRTQRRKMARSGRRGCYILPYSMLSTTDAEEIITLIAPQFIIGDEAHYLRATHSARTSRLLRVADKTTKEVAWLSGTITNKSIKDYYHLVLPFGELCPLPRDHRLIEEWSAVLDAGMEPEESNSGPILPLIEWAYRQHDAPDCPYNGVGFRKAYQHRLITNPIVVSTGDAQLGTSLTLRQLSVRVDPHEPTYRRLRELDEQVETEFLTPGGDEIEHAMHKFKWRFELSAGIYNELYWEDAPTIAKKRNITEAVAAEKLALAQYHHALLQEYAKCLREWLRYRGKPGLDTPFLVGGSLARHGNAEIKDEIMFGFWTEAKAIKHQHPDLVERQSRVIRVCDYKIRAAQAWAAEHGHGIIWFYHNGVGDWLRERMPDALYCPAGGTHDAAVLQSHNRIVLASIGAHGTGKNLQFHQHMLYVQFPRPANVAEQSIGRIHRFGQEADELIVDALIQRSAAALEPTFDELLYGAMLNDAIYVHLTTGSPQKVIYANYDPLPRVISSTVLAERGLDPKLLSRDQATALQERFQDQV